MSDFPEPTQQELETLDEVLRPVAKRHGMEMLNFALAVAGTNRAIDQLLALGDRFRAARVPANVILNNLATICNQAMEAKGWDINKVTECMQDVGRAQELAPPKPQIVLH